MANKQQLGNSRFESRNTVLTRKLNNVIYELMVKTHSDMVYVNDIKTLTEWISDFTDIITTQKKDIVNLRATLNQAIGNIDDSAFTSIKEIWDYVNINGDPKSELIQLIESKQASEEGKGLSTNDFTDILYEKLKNDYTKEELVAKFDIIDTRFKSIEKDIETLKESVDSNSNNNIIVSEDTSLDDSILREGCWFQIIKKD